MKLNSIYAFLLVLAAGAFLGGITVDARIGHDDKANFLDFEPITPAILPNDQLVDRLGQSLVVGAGSRVRGDDGSSSRSLVIDRELVQPLIGARSRGFGAPETLRDVDGFRTDMFRDDVRQYRH